ncbi:MAG: EAL domain-containing protein [Burkholderiaceae bacterium]
MLDLDQFKIVNDTCGHTAGDELLRQIASLLVDRAPAHALPARLGGDEFGLLLPSIGPSGALEAAESIRERIALHRFARDGKTFSSSASIGVMVVSDDMATAGVVLNAVDRACYMAKENGRNRVHVYRPDDEELRQRSGEMAVISQINSAFDDRRLILYGQEIRALGRDATDSHIELLVRMVSPDGKLVPPMSFIPAAERYGVMPRIDRWIITEAFATLRTLRDRGRPLPRCMVNLSGQSVADETLYDFIIGQFAESGLPYDRIGFEVTETSAITNMTVAVELMRRLGALGCVIALDDFGSGMSSFTYLRSMPVHCLKIDGNLVTDFRRNPVHRVMVIAIQQIARVIGVKTVAEWVEDEATCDELTRMGIDYAQGHYISRPEPLEGALARWRRRLEDRSADAADAGGTTAPASAATGDQTRFCGR